MVGPSAEFVSEQAGLAICDAVVGPSAELVSEQAGLAVCDAMVGLSAELDSMQAGFADCDTVVACCVDTVAVIEGLCNVDMVSGRDDTVGWGVDTKARLEVSWHIVRGTSTTANTHLTSIYIYAPSPLRIII